MPARPKVTKTGSNQATASFVIGKVPPKATTPRKPSRRPRLAGDRRLGLGMVSALFNVAAYQRAATIA
jgi:hypothetical protein